MQNHFKYAITLITIINILYSKTDIKLIKSTDTALHLEIEIHVKTAADLFAKSVFIGLPSSALPKTNLVYTEESPIPFKSEKSNSDIFTWSKVQKNKNLNTAVLIINPQKNRSSYFNKIKIELSFQNVDQKHRLANNNESKILSNKIINWEVAKNWVIYDERKKANKSSVRSSGHWISFKVYKDGMHAISYNQLKTVFNDIDNYNPKSLMLFTSPSLGRSKSQETNLPIADNMIEIPVMIEGQSDNTFSNDSRIIFYGRGHSGFDINGNEVKWNQNLYFNSNTYWIFLNEDNSLAGKRIEKAIEPDEINLSLDYGLSYFHSEIDLVNPDLSGLNWYGPSVSFGSSQIITTDSPHAKEDVDALIDLYLKGHSNNGSMNTYHSIDLHVNGLNTNKIGSTTSWSGNGARSISGSIQGDNLSQSGNTFYIKNISTDNNSAPYIDYLTVKYGRKLIFDSNELEFYSPISNANIRFNFNSVLPSSIMAFNITAPYDPKALSIIDNQKLEVILNNNSLSRFIIADKNNIQTIDELNYQPQIVFNSLRNENTTADYIIIGPTNFADAAQPILNLRSPSVYASLNDIYREFSAGNKDPMALRTFLQWTQEYWTNPKPIHVLLLGDAGYDYRNISGQSSIVVPTIQVASYISYPSDDRFATIYGNLPELSIGRFPAKNISEVENFSDKIVFIENNPNYGSWRQKITLVADDAARPEPNHGGIATGKSHTLNSETIAEIIPSKIDVEKIYMLEYPEVSDASAYGVTKPDATEAVLSALSSGTSIINYIGHGSAFQLAQEKLLYLNRGDIDKIKTNMKMPLWIVGTCSFGHFDDPISESFGEELIRYPMDAASAIISTCRPITVTGNERYTQDIFERIFNNNQASDLEIGIILQSIKNGSSESEYFHLFGDPAMKLSIPQKSFDSISIDPDTLLTLGSAFVSINQDIINNNGNGTIKLKDANRIVTRTYNIASTEQNITYTLPGPTLFRGYFNFSSSQHIVQLRVPQDISYSNLPAKVLVYLHNDVIDAISEINQVYLVGGDTSLDEVGPIIEFKTKNGRILRDGDHKGKEEIVVISLSDPLGINLTKELGHSIILENLLTNQSIDITDDFFYNLNSITTGEVTLNNYLDSDININISAWDNANNPSEKDIYIYSNNDSKLRIYNVFNFPNPFSDRTKFTFELSAPAEVNIYIYTIGGKKIKQIKNRNMSIGFQSIEWDGKNEYGEMLANGVYIYKINAKNNGYSISHIGRCAKFN